jgi:crossover junction endodeoxyribonuclease RuvC
LRADRIIGIDPGLNATGIGIVERDARKRPVAIYFGTIKPTRTLPIQLRLLALQESIRELIGRFEPGCMAVEEAFYHKNIKSTLVLGQARGAALLAAAEARLNVMEISPKSVKKAAVGNGSAAKVQVAAMIVSILQLDKTPESTDACDALAVALAALNRVDLPSAVVP